MRGTWIVAALVIVAAMAIGTVMDAVAQESPRDMSHARPQVEEPRSDGWRFSDDGDRRWARVERGREGEGDRWRDQGRDHRGRGRPRLANRGDDGPHGKSAGMPGPRQMRQFMGLLDRFGRLASSPIDSAMAGIVGIKHCPGMPTGEKIEVLTDLLHQCESRVLRNALRMTLAELHMKAGRADEAMHIARQQVLENDRALVKRQKGAMGKTGKMQKRQKKVQKMHGRGMCPTCPMRPGRIQGEMGGHEGKKAKGCGHGPGSKCPNRTKGMSHGAGEKCAKCAKDEAGGMCQKCAKRAKQGAGCKCEKCMKDGRRMKSEKDMDREHKRHGEYGKDKDRHPAGCKCEKCMKGGRHVEGCKCPKCRKRAEMEHGESPGDREHRARPEWQDREWRRNHDLRKYD
jgi:hypothetical protein